MSFFENYGETFSGRRGYVRDTVVAYLSDGVKQDELVKLSAAIPADLPVGSVVDSTGAIITTAADADYVVVEFAKAGATAIVVAKEGANKRGNSSRLTQSFHFFMFEPIFSPVNALNQPI